MLVLRQPMRVAMALIATMIFLAGIYGLLGMHFIAVFQVLIYVGAVMVFMVYVIMLLEVREAACTRFSRLLLPGAAGLLVLLFVLAASVWRPLPSPQGEIGDVGYGIAAFSRDFLGSTGCSSSSPRCCSSRPWSRRWRRSGSAGRRHRSEHG